MKHGRYEATLQLAVSSVCLNKERWTTAAHRHHQEREHGGTWNINTCHKGSSCFSLSSSSKKRNFDITNPTGRVTPASILQTISHIVTGNIF